MDVAILLDQLSELKAANDITRIDYEKKRKLILQQVQDELNDLDAEYNPLFETVGERIASLEQEIKSLVLAGRTSVRGSSLHAVYMNGRTSIDMARLDGYILTHPELNALKKLGEPSVQIRSVK